MKSGVLEVLPLVLRDWNPPSCPSEADRAELPEELSTLCGAESQPAMLQPQLLGGLVGVLWGRFERK